MTPSPEILAHSDPPSPESSKIWQVLPCSASTVRDRTRSSITLNKKSTWAFQWAINQGSMPPLTSSKWGSNTKICRLSDNFDNKGWKVCCKVSLYENCQQSCSAINCLSSGINIMAGGSSVPFISERKGSDPPWKQVHCLFLFSRWHNRLSAVVLYWSSVLC